MPHVSKLTERQQLTALVTALHRRMKGGTMVAFATKTASVEMTVNRSPFQMDGKHYDQWDFFVERIRLCTAITDKYGKLGAYSYPNGYGTFQEWLPSVAVFKKRPWYHPLRWEGRFAVKLMKNDVY